MNKQHQKNDGDGTVLPVTFVPFVTVVTKEGNKGNNSNEGNREQHTLKLDSMFSAGKSEREKLSVTYFNHPEGLTDQQAADELGSDREAVKTYRARLGDLVTTIGSDRPQKFTLSEVGRAQLELAYWEWKHQQDEAARKLIALNEATKDQVMQFLDLPAQIEVWRAFFEEGPYRAHLYGQVSSGKAWVTIKFNDLARHSPEIAELLLDQPVDALKAGEIAIEKMDIPSSTENPVGRMTIQVTGLPEITRLGQLETKHLGKFLELEAQVVVAGERRSQTIAATFECPSCGNIIPVVQIDQKFKEPSRCSCGRKGRFKLLSKELTDAMSVLVQQPIAELAGKAVQPSTIKAQLMRNLTLPEVRDQLGMSRIVRFAGVMEEVPVILKTGGQSTRSDWRFNTNSVTLVDHYDPKLRLTPERIQQIKEEARRPDFLQRLRTSYFPHHIGDDLLREFLVAQSVAMPLHLHTDEARAQADREAVHGLIMSPPGMGKSRNLGGRLLELVPISGRANGMGASRAGLTIGADQKDRESDLVIPSPQALPKANLGLFVLDELDKMDLDQQPVLNEALSEHQVTVAKRGANITLPSMICFLGLANPRSYDWDINQEKLQEVLNVHYTLLTRCVVWVLQDNDNEERDTQVALAILRRDENKPRAYDDDFLRDYILLARASVVPRMNSKAEELLAGFYAQLRKVQTRKFVGPRFIEQARSLILLHAKVHLRDETTEEDIRWSNDILLKQLLSVGFDPGRLPNTLPRMVLG